ncbi:DUF4167 domain-containing protein [Paremcibacter congregatus]|uniref:DUF4167 domain-containing protein n=1 Tax=Paremcibacter congregatus TaxID=2043170 RepID=UPI0030EEB5A2|tara:strand:- start:3192 stop:3968 length:777 start_codon:yes stop_codon:yes gene_type:complete
MKPNQNAGQNRQGRPHQNNNQKRQNKGRANQQRNQQPRNQQGRSQPSNSGNRQMESRGPGGNLRGNAKQLYEKYIALAQEKRASDRLEAESLAQHGDHYYRIYAETAASEAAAQVARDAEKARKAEAEAERRVNSKPVEDNQNKQEPQSQNLSSDVKEENKAGSVDKDVSKPESQPVAKKPKPEKQDSAEGTELPLTFDLGAPEAEAPKKRRGRPPKAKPEETASADEAEAPVKKVVRKPRKKVVVPSENTVGEKPAE